MYVILEDDDFSGREFRNCILDGEVSERYLISEDGIIFDMDKEKYKYSHDNSVTDKHQRIKLGKKNYYIHKLVAETFVPNDNPEINTIVRHYDDEPYNNHYTNLIWGTQHENSLDMIRNGKQVYDETRNIVSCESHGGSILTNNDVHEICIELVKGTLLKDLALIYNVDVDVIRHIYKRKSWTKISNEYPEFKIQESIYKGIDLEIKEKIINMLKGDLTLTATPILAKLNLEKNESTKGFIRYTKSKLKNEINEFND